MSIAFWCVLAAAVLPFAFTLAAKWSRSYDNAAPRKWLETTTGWRQRAHWVQLNSFEAYPPFAAAVIIAHLCRGPAAGSDALALLYVALRVGYGLCYLANAATLRSVLWFAANLCVIGLFLFAAKL